jgi:multicomponent Na+:H+ antiporter subunit E
MTVRLVLWRVSLFALLWVVLVEGDPAYFWYALLTVPVAAAASLAWLPPSRPAATDGQPGPPHTTSSDGVEGSTVRRAHRLRSAAALLAWLLWQSVRGGVDVAARAVASPVRVDPVEVVVPVRLSGGARAVALAVLGLLPGTIVSEVREHEAVVHTLSADLDSAQAWHELETRVLAVVGDLGAGAPRQ